MKIFTAHFPQKTFEDLLQDIKHIDFSLFVSTIPKTMEELSSINVLALAEPNDYFGWNKWVIENKDLFDVIFTFDDEILNNCDNARFLTLAHTWLKPDQYNKDVEKKFEVAHLCGALKKAPGHFLRHELMEREKEIKIPTRFFQTYGDRYNIEEARIGKEEVFSTSQFNIAIENVSKRGWFTEKLIDCFLLKNIPIYWGCSNIDEFFNEKGIIQVKNVDDIIFNLNNIEEKFGYYKDYEDAIKENFNEALKWINYEKALTNNIKEIFKFNKIK